MSRFLLLHFTRPRSNPQQIEVMEWGLHAALLNVKHLFFHHHVTIDLSGRPPEDYGIGDRLYAVRDVSVDKLITSSMRK